ncbi:hypothetical protein Tco_0525664 [Tanacetum coccineum]
METVSSLMVAAAKLLVLTLVIVNGDSPLPKRTIDGVEQTYPPTTAEEKLARKNELKARGTLLMDLPNEHQLKFNAYKYAKTLMEAIEKRFGGDKELKKTQKTLLKQQYENFNGSSLKGLDQTYDRLQKIISQLQILGSSISSQNSQNVAFVSSNNAGSSNQAYGSNSANTDSISNAVIYSFLANQYNSPQLNDEDLQQINVDDLEEMDLKWQMAMLTMRARRFLYKTGRKISANGSETIGFNKSKWKTQREDNKAWLAQDGLGYDWSDQAKEGPTNFALMAYTSSGSSSSSSSDSEVSTCSKACLKSYETLKEHYDNLTKDFNKSQLNVGAYKAGLESVEARLDVYKKNEVVFEEDIKILKLDIMLRDNALTELRKKFEKAKKERDDLKLTLEKFENSSKNLSKLLEIQVSDKFKTGVGYDSQVVDSQVFDSQVNDKYKTGEGYHAVPPPYTGNFMPPKFDLVLADKDEYIFNWISDSKDENETEFKSKQRKPSFAKVEFVKSNEHVKIPRESLKEVENNKQAKYPRKNNQRPREHHFPTPHDSPLHDVHSHGSDEGSLKLNELTNLVTKLSDRIGVLEDDLRKTKKTYSSSFTKLILRVTKLESQIKTGKTRRKARIVHLNDEDIEDDSSKQGGNYLMQKFKRKQLLAGCTQQGTASEVPVVSTAEENLSTAGRTFEPKKKSKKELEQERLSFVEAIRLEEQMNEEQRAQIARDEEIARQWDEEERQRAMSESQVY